MKSIELLKTLINRLEDYESKATDKEMLSLEGFLSFLQPEPSLLSLQSNLIEQEQQFMQDNPHRIDLNVERVIAQHLIVLNRYIKFYGKNAFQDSKIKTLEEFSFMMTIMQFQELGKSELIRRNITEKSSGIEIINRLIKNGLMIQVSNPNDHRSLLIQLSDIGKMELFKLFKNMDTLGKIATGPLTTIEKQQLAVILKKLDNFHFDNYSNKDLNDLDDYLPQNKH